MWAAPSTTSTQAKPTAGSPLASTTAAVAKWLSSSDWWNGPIPTSANIVSAASSMERSQSYSSGRATRTSSDDPSKTHSPLLITGAGGRDHDIADLLLRLHVAIRLNDLQE